MKLNQRYKHADRVNQNINIFKLVIGKISQLKPVTQERNLKR